MFLSFYSYLLSFSFFQMFLILGLLFVFFGYLFGISIYEFFNSNSHFECGFISNDFILFNNTSLFFEVCFIFLVLEFELIFITLFIIYFSFSSFMFFILLFVLLSFIVMNDFMLL